MLGIAILFGFNLLGTGLKSLFQLPLPGNVIGLILFTLALFSRAIKLEWVEASAQLLNKHMLLFFIPFLVGTMTFFPFIGEHLYSLIVTLVISTFLVLAVTGGMTIATLKKPVAGDDPVE